MKVSPYLNFTGKCGEAIALYEKAFGAKAEIMRYKDAPPSEGYNAAPETENFIMHASIALGNNTILLCDLPPDMQVNFNSSIAIMVTLDNIEQLKASFDILKEGGRVNMELQKTFWSNCFGSLEDKFGISWFLDIE